VGFDLHGHPPFVPLPLIDLVDWPPCSLELDLHQEGSERQLYPQMREQWSRSSCFRVKEDRGGSVKDNSPPRMSKVDSSRYEAAPQRTPWQLRGK